MSSKSLGVDIGDRVRELLKETGDFEVRRVDMVGAKVGSELQEKGLMAMLISISHLDLNGDLQSLLLWH